MTLLQQQVSTISNAELIRKEAAPKLECVFKREREREEQREEEQGEEEQGRGFNMEVQQYEKRTNAKQRTKTAQYAQHEFSEF